MFPKMLLLWLALISAAYINQF